MPAGGEPAGPPGGGNPGGIPCGRAGIPIEEVNITSSGVSISDKPYQVEMRACPAVVEILEADLVEAAACLRRVSIQMLYIHIPIQIYAPAGKPGGIPPGGIGNPGGRPAGGIMPPGGPKPGGAVFNMGLFADCPSAAYEFVILSMTLCAFSCPICW